MELLEIATCVLPFVHMCIDVVGYACIHACMLCYAMLCKCKCNAVQCNAAQISRKNKKKRVVGLLKRKIKAKEW